jgi:lysyl-tRNA synthetase class 1
MLKRFVGTRALDVSDIPSYMNELDFLENVYFGKKVVKDTKELAKLRGLYEYCWVMQPPAKPSVHIPYNLLVFLVKMAPKKCLNEFVTEKLQSYSYLQKEQKANADLARRVEYAFNWTQDFEEIRETPVSLTNMEKNAIKNLVKVIEAEDEADKIQNAIFNTAKNKGLKPGTFFEILYAILLGAPQGPRLGPYILAMGKQNVTAALRRAISKK